MLLWTNQKKEYKDSKQGNVEGRFIVTSLVTQFKIFLWLHPESSLIINLSQLLIIFCTTLPAELKLISFNNKPSLNTSSQSLSSLYQIVISLDPQPLLFLRSQLNTSTNPRSYTSQFPNSDLLEPWPCSSSNPQLWPFPESLALILLDPESRLPNLGSFNSRLDSLGAPVRCSPKSYFGASTDLGSNFSKTPGSTF